MEIGRLGADFGEDSMKIEKLVAANGWSPVQYQATICTNARLLSVGPQGTYLNEILIENQAFPFNKMHLKMSSAKWRPLGLGPNVLTAIRCDRVDLFVHDTKVTDPLSQWQSCNTVLGSRMHQNTKSLTNCKQFVSQIVNHPFNASPPSAAYMRL